MLTIKKLAEMLRDCYRHITDLEDDSFRGTLAQVELSNLLQLLKALHEETGLGISPDEIIEAKKENLMPAEYWDKLNEFIAKLEASA